MLTALQLIAIFGGVWLTRQGTVSGWVINTWGMTAIAAQDIFIVEELDNHKSNDRNKASIDFPGKPVGLLEFRGSRPESDFSPGEVGIC